jgi:hypothetical protein
LEFIQQNLSSHPHRGRILINVTGSILLKTRQCSGIVGENPIIIAVNGEGKDAKMYIIDVCYSRPGLNQTVGFLQPLAREVNVSELSRHLTARHRAK